MQLFDLPGRQADSLTGDCSSQHCRSPALALLWLHKPARRDCRYLCLQFTHWASGPVPVSFLSQGVRGLCAGEHHLLHLSVDSVCLHTHYTRLCDAATGVAAAENGSHFSRDFWHRGRSWTSPAADCCCTARSKRPTSQQQCPSQRQSGCQQPAATSSWRCSKCCRYIGPSCIILKRSV